MIEATLVTSTTPVPTPSPTPTPLTLWRWANVTLSVPSGTDFAVGRMIFDSLSRPPDGAPVFRISRQDFGAEESVMMIDADNGEPYFRRIQPSHTEREKPPPARAV
jgi:hypothetical protein